MTQETTTTVAAEAPSPVVSAMDPFRVLSLLLTRILLFFVKWINPLALEQDSDATDSGAESTSSDEKNEKSNEEKAKELDESKTQKPCGEYLKRWQLWLVDSLSLHSRLHTPL